jgi:hypothetical protein
MRVLLAVACVGSVSLGVALTACGGSTAGVLSGDGGGATAEGGGGSSGGGEGGSGSADATASVDGGGPTESGPAVPPCAAPSDPTKSALCVTVAPEAITFTSDPRFDGKGWLIAQVFSTAQPDDADGGEVPSLGAQTFGAPDAGSVDLSQPLPAIRFDGLPPGSVYPRVVFYDDPTPSSDLGAGDWLGGYDLSGGLGGSPPLVAQALAAGQGTSIAMTMTALRELVVTMERGVMPAGNGEGPATFVVTNSQTPATGAPLFGVGQNPCARVDGTNEATVSGFVYGDGPYYVAGILDDFGLADGGVSLPPGALTSLQVSSAGVEIPPADQLTYAPMADRVSQTISLDVVVPNPPATDPVSCP